MVLDDDMDAFIRRKYRWWTCSASRDHVKLGPVSVAWGRLEPDVYLSVVWNARHLWTKLWTV